MEVRNSSFAAFIDVFTANTYVMVIMSDSTICEYQSIIAFLLTVFELCSSVKDNLKCFACGDRVFMKSFIASAATLINIQNARKHFEKLEKKPASS
jgi:Ras-related GTP-binding protein A/B